MIVDLGHRGVYKENPNVDIIHRGNYKSLTGQQRRQAVELAIGHLKSDCRMNRCWLKGQPGDAGDAVLGPKDPYIASIISGTAGDYRPHDEYRSVQAVAGTLVYHEWQWPQMNFAGATQYPMLSVRNAISRIYPDAGQTMLPIEPNYPKFSVD